MKTLLFIGALVAGSWFAWNNVPGLKDDAMALINPRVKEAKLLTTLGQHLETIQENAQTLMTTASGTTRSQLLERNAKLIQESKALIQSISDLNSQDAGLVKSGISTLANLVFGSSPTPTPGTTTAPAAACPTP